MASVNSTTFVLVGEEGVILDPVQVRESEGLVQVRLAALLRAPASGIIEAQIAYAHVDGTVEALPGSTLTWRENRWAKVMGGLVGLGAFARRAELVALRVQARTIGGSGDVVLPTIFAYVGTVPR